MEYVVRVRTRPMDGWGLDLPMREEILQVCRTREEAEDYIEERRFDDSATACDVGQPYIQELPT
jgi:hypothetical protein